MNPSGLYLELSPNLTVSDDPAGIPLLVTQQADNYIIAIGPQGVVYQDSPLVLTFSGPVSLQFGAQQLLPYLEYALSLGGVTFP